jgi:hypothetical protein
MNTETLDLVVQSTSRQRFDREWRAALEDTLTAAGVAVVDVGGGTDLSTGISDNEYEITGSGEALNRSLTALRELGYRYSAFNFYGGEVGTHDA